MGAYHVRQAGPVRRRIVALLASVTLAVLMVQHSNANKAARARDGK